MAPPKEVSKNGRDVEADMRLPEKTVK